MKLNTVQKQIIQDSYKFIPNKEQVEIVSLPGSGKTTMLTLLAHFNKQKQFLYLTFMNSSTGEAEKKIGRLPNCKVSGIHAFAKKHTSLMGRSIVSKHSTHSISSLLGVNISLASKIRKHMEQFLQSNFLHISDYAKTQEFFTEELRMGIDTMITLMDKREIDLTHDYYLKSFAIRVNNGEIDLSQGYDCILIDEYQDINGAMSLIFRSKGSVSCVFAGDPNQAIFGFMGSRNSFSMISPDRSYTMEENYRGNDEVISYGNAILKSILGKSYTMKTVRKERRTISTKAVITRTNAKLIDYMDMLDTFCLHRESKDIFELPISLHLWKRKHPYPKRFYFLKSIKDAKSLKRYAKKMGDKSLLSAYMLTQKYTKTRLEDLYSKALHMIEREEAINLISAHGSKGQEWDKVRIASDFPNLHRLAKMVEDGERGIDELREEANLYFVAVTRAREEIVDVSPNATLTGEQKEYICAVLRSQHHAGKVAA